MVVPTMNASPYLPTAVRSDDHYDTTVTSPCKDTQRKANLDVRATPLVINRCILTAVVPLSKDNLIQGQISW